MSFLLFFLNAFAMPTSDFEILKNQIDDASFSSDKQALIEMAGQRSTFTCAQVKTLLSLISFESDQLAGLRTLAPKIEDPDRTFTILEVFSFSSSKEEAKKILLEKAPKQSLKEQMEEKERFRQEMEQREREIEAQKNKARQEREDAHNRRNEMEEGPILQWMGHCSNRTNECVRLNPNLFSPLEKNNKHNHKLILDVSGPGVIEITANLGKKYSCTRDKTRRHSEPLRIKKDISLSEGRNLINVTDLIPDWEREYAEIKVEKGFMTSIVRLDNWNRCP